MLSDNTNRADVVIIPSTPFASNTKWYKLLPDGSLKEYPKFVVDANGNGVLTLYDNDNYDTNTAWGSEILAVLGSSPSHRTTVADGVS